MIIETIECRCVVANRPLFILGGLLSLAPKWAIPLHWLGKRCVEGACRFYTRAL